MTHIYKRISDWSGAGQGDRSLAACIGALIDLIEGPDIEDIDKKEVIDPLLNQIMDRLIDADPEEEIDVEEIASDIADQYDPTSFLMTWTQIAIAITNRALEDDQVMITTVSDLISFGIYSLVYDAVELLVALREEVKNDD